MRPRSLFSQTASRGAGALRSDLALSPDECNQMIDLLGALVRIPSVSGEEGAVAALITDYCRKYGLDTLGIDAAGNLLIQIGGGAGPTLLYDAHMDTVSPSANGWLHPPFEAVIHEDVLYGMGACDTKASIAAMITAGRKLLDRQVKLGGNLLLAFVVQEEPCEGCGLKVLIDHSRVEPDWVVLGEPTNLGIMRGHRGRVLFKVTVNGRSSHASKPELGDNAVTAAARLIFGIELLAADLPTDPVLGVGTIAVTHIESQAASMNAIPHTCTFYVDRRLTLGETSTRAQAQIESMIQREGIDAQVSVMDYRAESYAGYALATNEDFSPWVLEETHPLVHAASQAIKTVQGRVPHIGEGYFSTDGVYSMGVAGIPTIGFGPGDPKHAHTSLEQVRLADVAVAAHSYALLAAALLGEG
jgi:putative selenium metabolism hydrolase